MRILAALMAITSVAWPQQEDRKRAFLELNPGYRERTGSFYESAYLDPAAESLAKLMALDRFGKDDAKVVLKQFIYDFLDGYIEAGGEMPRAAHAAAVKRADSSMKKVLDDESAFKRWSEWRQSTNRADNALSFIMSEKVALTGVTLRLPEAVQKEGWTTRMIEDDERAVTYASGLPFVPHQVLIFERGAGASFKILVHRAGRATELLAALDKLTESDVRVFWRTQQFLLLGVEEGTVPDLLKESLRRQLAKQ